MTSGFDLTVDFDQPYFEGGSGTAQPVPPWAVSIDNHVYLLDTQSGDYRREGVEVLQQRNTSNQRDILLLPQEVWRQQTESWHQGAGQFNLDREDALPYRFYRSYGIDPWTRYQLSLLNDTSKIHTLSNADACFLQVHKNFLVALYGTTTKWFTTPVTSVTLSSGVADKVISVTYDGDAVIALHDGGQVLQYTNSTTVTARTVTPPVAPAVPNPVTDATFVAYVKDYLILGVGNQLWNITATQATLIYQSPVTGFTWKGAAEGLNAIYCIGGSGDKHVIHRIGVQQDGTGLTTPVVAATLPDGENGVSIGSYLGYVFVGTDKGVRMATPSGSGGDLVLGALIPTTLPVYGFEGQDRFVWATGSSIDPVPTGGDSDNVYPTQPVPGLYRLDLSTFTVTDSTPAYATDLTATTTTGLVRSVTTWNNKRVFCVENNGIWLEGTDKIQYGWLEQGRVSFSVEDLKTALYAQCKWEPLQGVVKLFLAYDGLPALKVLDWNITGTVRSGNVPLNGQQFSRVDSRIDLVRYPSDHTKGPIFTRFEIRTRPVKGSASRWYFPIINHEELDLNEIPTSRNVVTELENLLNLVESGRMFSLQEHGRNYQAVAKDYKWLPQKLNSNGTGWQGVFLLICEEVK